MSELGFAPERDPAGETDDQVLIQMTACPLRELARTHSEVVCGVHLGLMREVLDRNGARDTVNVRLHPFVEPELCVARLEAIQNALVPDPHAMPDAPPEGPVPRIAAPAGSRVAPQLRSADPQLRGTDPQLRNGDSHVTQQPTQQR
jgi:hypothetical protein